MQRAAEAILSPPSLPDAASTPESAAPASLRVFIHHQAGSAVDAAQAQRLAEELRQQGFAVVGIRPVPFSIGSGSMRYFFAADRSGARRLLAASDGYLGQPADPARNPIDFSRYEPKPSPGTVEIWLPSHP